MEKEEEVLKERWELARVRIAQIAAAPEFPGAFGDYFKCTADFLLLMLEAWDKARDRWMQDASLGELEAWNLRLYGELTKDQYKESYANPAYAAERLGTEHGQILSFLRAELQGLTVYAYEQKQEEMLVYMELFLQIHAEFEGGNIPEARQLKDDIYWFVSDYSDLMVAGRVREQIDPSLSFARDIIMEADLADPRYLYRFGEYISDTERKTSVFLNSLPQEEIDRIASVFTEGYRMGFLAAGKPLEKKKTVNIRYSVGFERIIRRAVENFKAMGLESIIYRAAVSRVNMREANRIGYYSSSPNRQFDYDHKGDAALFLDKAFAERKLGVLRTAYERQKELAAVHGGPAVMEIFGETPFEPEKCPEALKLSEKQQAVQVYLNSRMGQITNEYIKGEERSFTIIAFPVPDIGERFEDIFRETVRINTLDYQTYQRIQQRLIDALDQGTAVHILGKGENHTDLRIALWPLENPDKETNFENCVADVNIPVGEVFTSPRLTGTDGTLHVTGVYLNGLFYRDLTLVFRDGMVESYGCRNYGEEEENARYIRENIMYHHDTLPLGEFAVGTNTTAYVAAKTYGIEDRLPILIAEKMGPHFAVGDTCYSWEEDVPTFNPDGKRIMAKENECSARRKEDAKQAYFNCHTDITIPYDEIGEIAVVHEDGSRTALIRDGRFVLPGTEELNEPFA